jgi:SAM-dependent methyltransferase
MEAKPKGELTILLKSQGRELAEVFESKVRAFDSLARAYDSWFEQEGKLIFALEVEALKQVLPLLPKPWIEMGRGEEAPFKDASFGAIFFIATLYFIDSPERILSGAARLLKNGGGKWYWACY